MGEFIGLIFSFPILVYTFLLCIVVLYWLLVILGALDIDVFGGDADVDVDAGIDVDAGVDLDADVDVDVDGGGDGASGAAGLASLLIWLGLRGVPLTVLVSFWALLGWFLSIVAVDLLGAIAANAFVRIGVLAGTMMLSLLALSAALRPFRKYFEPAPVTEGKSMIGKICQVTSQRVDAHRGQARIEDGPDVFDVYVRCHEDNDLTRGEQALIIDYEANKQIYQVVPMDDDELLGLSDVEKLPKDDADDGVD